jgi:3-oxoacyl-[acyl-carrier-protein] synthase II
MNRRVVITGVGAVTPLGVGSRTLLDGWAAGCSGLSDGLGRCADFDPRSAMTRKQIVRSDRFTQLAIAAAGEAVREAGWEAGLPYEPNRIGCIVGTGIGGLATMEVQHSTLTEIGEEAVSVFGVPMLMSNAAPGAVAMRYGLQGPNWGVVSACAAGAHAIGTAVGLIRSGGIDAIVTGGAESALTPLALAGFARMRATSRVGISRPFDARRDGFVIGEGAGMLVLEEAAAAQARGATVLGEILGFGATSDAYHLTAPEPTGDGAAKAIGLALQQAELSPADIDYVNAHGTSTPLNDRAETFALKRALREHAATIPVSSLKSAIGHLLGAAGAVEAVATVLALRSRIAPPTLNWNEPEAEMDLDYVPGVAKPLTPRTDRAIGLSNSFGFGGHNAVICLAA